MTSYAPAITSQHAITCTCHYVHNPDPDHQVRWLSRALCTKRTYEIYQALVQQFRVAGDVDGHGLPSLPCVYVPSTLTA